MSRTWLAVLRLTAFGAVTLVAAPLQVIALALRIPLRETVPQAYHRLCCRLMGLRLEVMGTPSLTKPTLFIANHSSYLDIPVLGALIRGSFVAKTEVAGWPVFGWLAKLQRTVFVERKPRRVRDQTNTMLARLKAADSLVLFPEGTSSDGNRTLPFKSGLFAVANLAVDGEALTVQPVSITCTRLDGIPLGRRMRGFYAWYGDMDMLPHLWRMAGLGRLTVAVVFHPPVTADAAGSRKALARLCYEHVSAGVAAANAGRQPLPVAA